MNRGQFGRILHPPHLAKNWKRKLIVSKKGSFYFKPQVTLACTSKVQTFQHIQLHLRFGKQADFCYSGPTFVVMVPSPSLSKSLKAFLNSATCSSDNSGSPIFISSKLQFTKLTADFFCWRSILMDYSWGIALRLIHNSVLTLKPFFKSALIPAIDPKVFSL